MGMKQLKHLIAILLMLAPLVIIDAQSLPHAGNHRSFGWDLGYGFYDPAPHTRFAQYPDRFTGYGGLLISVRYLGKPVRLVPSLSLGVEAGVQTLAHEESSLLYYIDSGDPVIESVDGVIIQALADVALPFASPAHLTLGYGVLRHDEGPGEGIDSDRLISTSLRLERVRFGGPTRPGGKTNFWMSLDPTLSILWSSGILDAFIVRLSVSWFFSWS